MAVADGVIAGIDRDNDGAISPTEKQAYASDVLTGLRLEMDGRSMILAAVAADFARTSVFTSPTP